MLGSSLQVFQEETEFQQGIDDVRGRRRAAGAAGASQQLSQAAMIAQQEQQAALQLKDAALLYARCLQQLLKVRCLVFLSWVVGGCMGGRCIQQLCQCKERQVLLQAAMQLMPSVPSLV
jgi:hypothetical protein